MQKFTVNNFQKIGFFIICVILGGSCQAQIISEKHDTFLKIYKNYPKVSLPLSNMLSLRKGDTINAKLLNKLLFDLQKDKAKHYINDTLFEITSYGRIREEPFKFNTFKRVNGERIRYDTIFPINVYPLGRIMFDNNHVGLITRVVGFMTDYIDIYLFDISTGDMKSLINAFEAAYNRHGYPEEGYRAIYNTSSITEGNIIKWHQKRYNIITDRIFEVSPDGFFRIVNQKTEGSFDY